MVKYVPDAGDVIWLDFDPQQGKEITKRRPALVLSTKTYNSTFGLCIVCPISSQIKGHLLEVPLAVKNRQGVVKADQVKSVDWRMRRADFIHRAKPVTLSAVRDILSELIL